MGLSPDEFYHLLCALKFTFVDVEREVLEIFGALENIWIELTRQSCCQWDSYQELVMGLVPFDTIELLASPLHKLVQFPVFFEHALEFSHFEFFRITCPLQHLQVEDR